MKNLLPPLATFFPIQIFPWGYYAGVYPPVARNLDLMASHYNIMMSASYRAAITTVAAQVGSLAHPPWL